MGRIYISFLGLGIRDEKSRQSEYRQTVYELNGQKSVRTQFVQAAEIAIIGGETFDRIIIVATNTSYNAHFKKLNEQLRKITSAEIVELVIEEDMSAEGQWKWFEKILDHIEFGDELTIDLTHGYRSIPIVFSTAVNFLQRAKDIRLNAVYYGAYEKDRQITPIVDMKEFYVINEWAEAVSRLVEDADARKIAAVAEKTPEFQAGELNDKKMIAAFEDLTNTIRNVDVNNVSEKATAALALVESKQKKASAVGKILLKLFLDKFAVLATAEPGSGRYDLAYFRLQLEIIKLLLEHKLFMQAYTVMREFVGSIGLIEIEKAKVKTNAGRSQRHKYAEVFFNMLQFAEEQWNFPEGANQALDKLRPYYDNLKIIGVESMIREFTSNLTGYRNGFDHAWTARAQAPPDIEKVGNEIYDQLSEIIQRLNKNGILN
jgi:CRISPR-associated DxTHG motif protein